MLKARAEVERLAGASGHAAASLRAALQIYEDRRATTLAEQVRAALASLTTQPPLFSDEGELSGHWHSRAASWDFAPIGSSGECTLWVRGACQARE